MKNFKMLLGFFIIMVIANSCDFPKYSEIGESPSISNETLKGSWKLEKVVQVDNIAASKGFPIEVQSMDLTNRVPSFKQYEITFNEGGSYMVTNPSNAPVFIPAAGKWAFDDKEGSRKIAFTDAANKITNVEFANAYRVGDNKLTLGFTRRGSDGKPYLSYMYDFVRK